MFLRNLMSMDTEEMIRAQPCDVVVAIGGLYALFMRCAFIYATFRAAD